MKALKLPLIVMLLFLGINIQAQVSVSVNIGTAPAWGPVGYTGVRYYYLPDVESYYDVQTSMFIYYEGNNWVHRAYLPHQYRDYDLYGGYKVVMKDYRGDRPYSNFREYRTRYSRGYHNGQQRTIGERHGNNGKMRNDNRGNPHSNGDTRHKTQDTRGGKKEHGQDGKRK